MRFWFGRKRRSKRSQSDSSRIPLVRMFGPGATVAGLLGLLFMLLTGRVDLPSLDALNDALDATVGSQTAAVQPVNLQTLGAKSPETIRLATFNVKVFGKKKTSDVNVLGRIAQIVAQFDVVAIQEVRGGDAAPIQSLVDLLRASGGQYTATVSEPIGRSTQTESYAFVWDQSRVRMVPDSAYLVQDPADRLEREPMVASFETRAAFVDGRSPFRFTLINAHTKPSAVVPSAVNNEMNVLDDVFISVRNYEFQAAGEDDCILLGDLNVSVANLGELGQIPGIESVAGSLPTNTRRTETYDHILIDRFTTREYTGRSGVLDFQRDFGLTEEQALMISDHQPVWAEFSVYEMPRFDPVAAGQPAVR